jgi:protein phosphatase
MQVAIASLVCPNQNCQAPNPETHRFCQMCRTPLLKRYLWVAGYGLDTARPGDLIQNRFLVKSTHVVLDVQPNLPIYEQSWDATAERNLDLDLDLARPYLKLFSLRQHIPQPYTVLNLTERSSKQPILLLEQAPIRDCDFSSDLEVDAISVGIAKTLETAWSSAAALRQLNWLWQIAQLWRPLVNQRVASSLLQPELLRVEGSLVRLLELRSDQDWIPKLSALGYLWKQWLPGTHVSLRPFLSQLCQHLIEGQIETIEDLIDQLDLEIQQTGNSQSLGWAIATQTDQGPTRSRNEDACYPSDSNRFTEPLTIVCDGMGGHAGGDIASSLAIATVAQQLQSLSPNTSDTTTITNAVEDAIYNANDIISAQNDQNQRHAHGRMGTTLVMALLKAPKLYIAHAGDSRAYYITRTGCYSITTDHNLLSRWIETGYGFYREMLQSPEGSKLFQAVGFSPSDVLQPDIQSLVIDEDCVILLCSDGLSDHQLVEECWQTEILPILQGDLDLSVASRRLVDLANHRNGHDNVTVSLIHCTVS